MHLDYSGSIDSKVSADDTHIHVDESQVDSQQTPLQVPPSSQSPSTIYGGSVTTDKQHDCQFDRQEYFCL